MLVRKVFQKTHGGESHKMLTLWSVWYFTERMAPKKMGRTAIRHKLPYAMAIPSGVAGIFAVALPAVSFIVALTAGASVTVSAMLTVSFVNRHNLARSEQRHLLITAYGETLVLQIIIILEARRNGELPHNILFIEI